MTAFVTPFCTYSHAHAVGRKSTHPLRICTWRGSSPTQPTLLSSLASSSFTVRQFPQERRPNVLRRQAAVRRVPAAILGGGGFLGVGPAEVVICIAVGWLFLGPEKLYSLSKDMGKLLGELRRTADEARDSFSDAMDYEISQDDPLKNLTASTTTKEKEENEGTSPTAVSIKDKEAKSASSADGISDNKHGDAELNGNNVDKEDIPQLLERPISEILAMETLETSPSEETMHAAADTAEVQPQQANTLFLDQLKRVSDPNQVAPSEIPDLDIGLDMEEMEVQRLEEQYLEARARLEARKNVVNSGGKPSADDVDPSEPKENSNERKNVEPTSV